MWPKCEIIYLCFRLIDAGDLLVELNGKYDGRLLMTYDANTVYLNFRGYYRDIQAARTEIHQYLQVGFKSVC